MFERCKVTEKWLTGCTAQKNDGSGAHNAVTE